MNDVYTYLAEDIPTCPFCGRDHGHVLPEDPHKPYLVHCECGRTMYRQAEDEATDEES